MTVLRKVIPSRDALSELMECLLLAFWYERRRGRLVMVTDYPDKESGADRSFLALVFVEVTEFVRESGRWAPYAGFVDSYAITPSVPSVVVQSVRFSDGGGQSTLECWFGPNFGGLRLRYGGLAAIVRDARVKRSERGFEYTDLRSGLPFEFSSPFSVDDIEAATERAE
jgi:hypothetical protein